MTCYHPIPAWREPHGGVVFYDKGGYDRCDVPCGKCLGCRTRRAQDWSVRCFHESQLYERNCFITLTYARDNCPPGFSLDHRDWQLFMKRMVVRANPVRFFMCGEYGPVNLRPHYHAILFGMDFTDRKPQGVSKSGEEYFKSARLEQLWKLGQCSVQDVSLQSISYCTRYIIDKVETTDADELYTHIDADGVITPRKPEYCAVSNRPGIGQRWFEKFGKDVVRGDYVVLEGHKFAVPKYYDKLMRRGAAPALRMDEIEFGREKRAKAAWSDNTDERLAVREVVHSARVRNLKREMKDG